MQGAGLVASRVDLGCKGGEVRCDASDLGCKGGEVRCVASRMALQGGRYPLRRKSTAPQRVRDPLRRESQGAARGAGPVASRVASRARESRPLALRVDSRARERAPRAARVDYRASGWKHLRGARVEARVAHAGQRRGSLVQPRHDAPQGCGRVRSPRRFILIRCDATEMSCICHRTYGARAVTPAPLLAWGLHPCGAWQRHSASRQRRQDCSGSRLRC